MMSRKKPLSETNPHIRDPVERKRLITKSVRSSCGVEGIKANTTGIQPIEIKHRTVKRIHSQEAICTILLLLGGAVWAGCWTLIAMGFLGLALKVFGVL